MSNKEYSSQDHFKVASSILELLGVKEIAWHKSPFSELTPYKDGGSGQQLFCEPDGTVHQFFFYRSGELKYYNRITKTI